MNELYKITKGRNKYYYVIANDKNDMLTKVNHPIMYELIGVYDEYTRLYLPA